SSRARTGCARCPCAAFPAAGCRRRSSPCRGGSGGPPCASSSDPCRKLPGSSLAWTWDLLLLLQPLGCGLDGLDDVRVAGAAAEIAADGLADLRLGGSFLAGEQGAGGQH